MRGGVAGLEPEQRAVPHRGHKGAAGPPRTAAIVSSPRIFSGLTAPPKHGETPEDIAAAAKEAADWRAKGGFTAKMGEIEYVLEAEYTKPMLDSVVKARGGSGAPTAVDSAATRGAVQKMVDAMVA